MKNLKLKTSIKNPIFRERGPTKTRFKYLRLDKNERISEFKNKLFTKIKKKINHNHLTAYPELEKLYGMIDNKTLGDCRQGNTRWCHLSHSQDLSRQYRTRLHDGSPKTQETLNQAFGVIQQLLP